MMTIHKLVRHAALALGAIAVVLGVMLSTTTTAQAITADCGGGRCTVWLSKSDTAAMGQGRAPAPPASLPWQLKSAYWALVAGHRWFAQQYASRGWCSAFRLSMYPWETQGYVGYRC
ncbi:hypothetical protein [Antrihabitans spumae]|uniref:Uncharacterized protein n=1 Tax=Antrihabitans spumae TaxID=3373370 RepID=A0ABW7JIV0_9NOCA